MDFVRDSHAIMWNNGTLYPIKGKFVDDSVCDVVPKGSTWARNPIPRIHTDNLGAIDGLIATQVVHVVRHMLVQCWSNVCAVVGLVRHGVRREVRATALRIRRR